MHEKTKQKSQDRLTTAATIEESNASALRPEFFRMPSRGGDKWFGLTRAWYYAAERQGLLTLIRLRQRGKQRGVVLVSYEAVKLVIEEASK